MENLFLILATSLVLRISAPKFRRFLIGKAGSALLLSDNRTIHFKHTKEGDRIYFYDHQVAGVTYGFICAQMKDVYTLPQAEKILVHYINRVRKPFNIAHNISMEIEKMDGQITITDYWQDEQGVDWKIKGYTNGKTVAVFYVRNIGGSLVKEQEDFLNGFKFSYAG